MSLSFLIFSEDWESYISFFLSIHLNKLRITYFKFQFQQTTETEAQKYFRFYSIFTLLIIENIQFYWDQMW